MSWIEKIQASYVIAKQEEMSKSLVAAKKQREEADKWVENELKPYIEKHVIVGYCTLREIDGDVDGYKHNAGYRRAIHHVGLLITIEGRNYIQVSWIV